MDEKYKFKIKTLEVELEKKDQQINELRKLVARLHNRVNSYINRQSAEIRVVEDDGSWGDYSGVFYLDPQDEKDLVIKKAKNHFNTYFKDAIYHQDKNFGIFLSNPLSGRHLEEELNTLNDIDSDLEARTTGTENGKI